MLNTKANPREALRTYDHVQGATHGCSEPPCWCDSPDVNTLPGPAGGPGSGFQEVGELVHAYGRQFLQRHVQLALEYYMLAARAAGDALPAKGRLLKELLTESKAYGVCIQCHCMLVVTYGVDTCEVSIALPTIRCCSRYACA